jgi:hypothetical protein
MSQHCDATTLLRFHAGRGETCELRQLTHNGTLDYCRGPTTTTSIATLLCYN